MAAKTTALPAVSMLLVFVVEVDGLQDTGNPQEILAVPHRDALLDGVDQHHSAHSPVRFGKRSPRQRGQFLGNQDMQV